ncbi:hypothetical protein J155_00719 [Xanthomonas citri pv. citri]|nr:hypothetical protein J151_00721 [Xanthomonas citri subsp. citri A306]AJY80724.1 hypothetical protein J159_00718 [Xanthomonas citri pv. citri]AJY85146.1 hypothetical protein J158_00718 [Xanthomonas citri subsp. citri UI6]AJY89569.1 hypothetical protein J169_00717 [Xanthomonas citri pv. citri]AJY94040.1 hypothetical protein J164_00717 [Xanthomonas citri pv. citri]
MQRQGGEALPVVTATGASHVGPRFKAGASMARLPWSFTLSGGGLSDALWP